MTDCEVGDTVDRISFNSLKKIIEEFNKDYSNKLKTELEDAGFTSWLSYGVLLLKRI
jgi:uracil DNA glycosylase